MCAKKRLRKKLRSRRQSIDAAEHTQKSLAIASQVTGLASWSYSNKIAVYSASDGEIDPMYIAKAATNSGKSLFLPVVKNDGALDFALWCEDTNFIFNRFGIREPDENSPRTQITSIEIICVPLVGWDRSGNRLGMGGGFYDRTLSNSNSSNCLVGLAFGVQECEEIPTEPSDVPLDFVITENEIICTGRKINATSTN